MNPFDDVTQRLGKAGGKLPILLAAAYTGLELATSTTNALTDTCPDNEVPAYLTALNEAAQARDALAQAPSLVPIDRALPEPPTTGQDVADQVAAMAMALAQALVAAAEHSTDQADKIACLQAALHTGRLHEALR